MAWFLVAPLALLLYGFGGLRILKLHERGVVCFPGCYTATPGSMG